MIFTCSIKYIFNSNISTANEDKPFAILSAPEI